MTTFILYSRSYCHLCNELLQALQDFLGDRHHEVLVLDVDADPALLARFDERVPVLFGIRDGEPDQELCHYFMDRERVAAFLQT